jgi:phosphoglycolate phosphatase-like HAD superfamily hydrolase
MLYKIAKENRVELENSIFIGDSETDILCAKNAKCKSIYIGKSQINQIPTHYSKNSGQLMKILELEKCIDIRQ